MTHNRPTWPDRTAVEAEWALKQHEEELKQHEEELTNRARSSCPPGYHVSVWGGIPSRAVWLSDSLTPGLDPPGLLSERFARPSTEDRWIAMAESERKTWKCTAIGKSRLEALTELVGQLEDPDRVEPF